MENCKESAKMWNCTKQNVFHFINNKKLEDTGQRLYYYNATCPTIRIKSEYLRSS